MSLRIFVVCSKQRDGTSCVARLYDALFPSPSKDDGASDCDVPTAPWPEAPFRFKQYLSQDISKAAYGEYCDGHSESSVTLNWMLCPVQSQQSVSCYINQLQALTPSSSVHPVVCSDAAVSQMCAWNNVDLFVWSAAQIVLQSTAHCSTVWSAAICIFCSVAVRLLLLPPTTVALHSLPQHPLLFHSFGFSTSVLPIQFYLL